MTTKEPPSRIRRLSRWVSFATEATWLNGSVMWLEIRLWWAKKRIEWMLGSIDDVRDRMRHACQREADRALRTIKRSTPIRSIGLSKVIVNSLERAGVDDLSELNPNVYKLESIPNIGPARSKSIVEAYQKAMKKVALEACLDPEIDERVLRFVLFRSSANTTIAELCSKQEALNRESDDFVADIREYAESPGYRAVMLITRQSLRQQATALFEEIRNARKKTAQGEMVLPPEIMSAQTLRSLTSNERGAITFRFDVRYARDIEIRGGRIVS